MPTILSDLVGTLRTAFRIARSTIDASGLTVARTHTLPNKSGTFAMLDDVGGGGAIDWTVVTAGQTLADDTPLLAALTTSQTFPAPASPSVGDEYVLRNFSGSTAGALAIFDPGAGRTVTYGAGQSLPVADTLTASPGETIHVVCRNSTTFELLTPGAVGPAGPAGSPTPAGSNTQVQYNNAGALAGATNVGVESNRLVHADYEEFVLQSASVATPSAGRGRIYMRQRGGRTTLETIGPAGVDNALQPALYNNRVMLISPNTTTTVTAIGINATTAATLSHPALATTSLAASLYRTRCTTSATAGNAAGIRHGVATMFRGVATAWGGFYFHARVCSGSLTLTGCQHFIGLSSSVAALAGEPSALADAVGLVKDSADTAWQFVRRTGTGTAQKVALTTGLTYGANQVLDVIIYSAPNGTGLGCVVRSFSNTGVPTTHLDTTYTTDIPAAGTLLAGRFDIRNGAVAAAADFDLVRMYAESDF